MSESPVTAKDTSMSEASPQSNANILRRDTEEYKVIKKLPRRFPTRFNDIYVTNRTDFKVQLEKCQKILSDINSDKEPNEIVLHAMGPAINRQINLVFRLL